VGKTPSEEIDVGEPVLAKHFSEASRISRALQPGERAVAVRVDGVTGLGGFVAPGDSVDVLFFARRDGREIPDTQARVLLEGARVLAFGTRLESKGSEPETNARTAVLAVREKDAASLLLADAAGTLRLCLHQASDSGAESTGPVVTLEEITGRRAPSRAPRADAFPIDRGFE
jgi:pilus assembly protein CpaB